MLFSCSGEYRATASKPFFGQFLELDFSHLRAKGVRVRSSPVSAKRGDLDAYPTYHDDTAFGSVCATVLKARLAKRPGALDGCDPRPGPANGQLGLACDGPGPIRAVPPLPPSSQPR